MSTYNDAADALAGGGKEASYAAFENGFAVAPGGIRINVFNVYSATPSSGAHTHADSSSTTML
jgi:hypothetical protein